MHGRAGPGLEPPRSSSEAGHSSSPAERRPCGRPDREDEFAARRFAEEPALLAEVPRRRGRPDERSTARRARGSRESTKSRTARCRNGAPPRQTIEPVDGFLPRREEAHLPPGVGLAHELSKVKRVGGEVGDHPGHSDVVVGELLGQLAGDARAEVEECGGQSAAIEKERPRPLLDAAHDRCHGIDRVSAVGFEESRHVRFLSAIAGYVGGFACVLNFGDVPPGIGLAAVEIGEAVDLRQLPAG